VGQAKLNKELDALLETIENTLPRKSGQLNRAVDRARLTVEDILAKYADGDGKIPRNKTSLVLRDLQRIEGEIYRSVRTEFQQVFADSAKETSMALSLALMTAIDTATLLSVAGITGTLASLGANAAYLILEALLRKTREDFAEDIAKTPFNRKDDDGKRLNDRLKDIARTIHREVSSTLRKSIRNGEVTSRMNRKVKRDFSSLAWRLKTIVETEVLYVMRNGIATFAELSGIAKGLRIKDHPHGKPGEHESHKCYEYAHQDEHGMGEGVYPVTTRKIRHPHPRCRSTLHIVLIDKLA
jgi:hypothetical protein